MFRRFTIAFALVVVMVTTMAGPALAGGWSVVTLDESPTGIEAGTPFTVGFMVRQHGKTPMAGLKPLIMLVNRTTGERLTVTALPNGPTGHYIATLMLSSPGEWAWWIEAHGRPAELTPINVSGPGAAPVAPTAKRVETLRSDNWVALASLVVLCALSGVGILRARQARLAARG